MIKIISSWSNPGGSTSAYIDLCNLFNLNGIDCIFFGPHDYHLDKCRSKKITNLENTELTKEDNVIIHNFIPSKKLFVKKTILSCHEKHSFPIAWELIKLGGKPTWDLIHFITDEQRHWHSIFSEECIIIGNYINLDFTVDTKTKKNIVGVIGTIEPRKRTFESVKKAIEDNNDLVYLYGSCSDSNYLQFILNTFGSKVIYKGYIKDKKQIYNSIDKVYHLSRWEIACLVQGECKILGIPFVGSEFCPDYPLESKEQVLLKWKKVFNI